MQQKPRGSVRKLLAGTWAATRGVRPRTIVFLLLFVVSTCLDLLAPWAIGYTLGIFVEQGLNAKTMEQATHGIIAYAGIRFLIVICHHLARYYQLTTSFVARMNQMTDTFSDLLRFPLRWHMESHSGENVSRLQRSAGAVDNMVATYSWQVVEGVIKTVGATAALFALDSLVAINVLVISVLTIGTMLLFNKRLIGFIRENNLFANKLNRIYVDYLGNFVTVKMLGLETAAVKYLESIREQGYQLSKKIAGFAELKWSTTGIGYSVVIGSSLYIYFYKHQGLENAFDVAAVYVLLNYLDRIFGAITSFTGYYGGIIEAATAYEDAVRISERAREVRSKTPLLAIDHQWQTLTFERLDFSFIRGELQGFHAVNLAIHRGEKIALVGPSGGGKSTFLKLLAGMIEPEAFRASTDVQPEISPDHVTSQALIIPQEPEIFSESLRFNLTAGEPVDDAQLSFFVSLCQLEEVLAKLNQGWETVLVEKGQNLSGGERQRIALARGLIRAGTKPLILLDEPTSSLDPHTEKEVFLGLLYYFRDRTVIAACHRLALVPLFDRVLFVSGGRAVEFGTFSELLEQKGAFFRAWDEYERAVQASSKK